jgi:putative flippase GtrA
MIQILVKYKQLVKYGLVGAANTLISFAVFYVLHKLLGVNYKIANPIAYVSGMLNGFYFNKKWTFKSDGSLKREAVLFLAVNGVSLLTQYLIITMLVEKMGQDPLHAQVVGTLCSICINFLGQKFLAFKN